jgi:hypothetical protein
MYIPLADLPMEGVAEVHWQDLMVELMAFLGS